jgi:ATP-dependent RNA helicase SUPV3L1/SUV3
MATIVAINRRASAITMIPHMNTKVKQLGITAPMFDTIAEEFNRDLASGKLIIGDKDRFSAIRGTIQDRRALDAALYSAFLDYAEPRLPKEISSKIASLKKITDLRFPQEWYPEARRMQRYSL